MGNAAKRSAKKLERRKKRAAEKEAKKKLYQMYAEQGRKKGSKRLGARRKMFLVPNVKHATGVCPNTGCHRCHPAEYNIPALERQLIRRGMAKWNPLLLKVQALSPLAA